MSRSEPESESRPRSEPRSERSSSSWWEGAARGGARTLGRAFATLACSLGAGSEPGAAACLARSWWGGINQSHVSGLMQEQRLTLLEAPEGCADGALDGVLRCCEGVTAD